MIKQFPTATPSRPEPGSVCVQEHRVRRCDSGGKPWSLSQLTRCGVEEDLATGSVGCPAAGPTASMGVRRCPSMSRHHGTQPIPHPESVGMRDAGFPWTTCGAGIVVLITWHPERQRIHSKDRSGPQVLEAKEEVPSPGSPPQGPVNAASER